MTMKSVSGLTLISMSKRKHTHHKIIKLTKKEILMIEDRWYARYNKAYYNINTNKVG